MSISQAVKPMGRPPIIGRCPYGCGEKLAVAKLREHMPRCPKRPLKKQAGA